MSRTRILLITTAAITALAASPALAHVQIASTSPGKGKAVKHPSSVSITFNGQIRRGTLKVVGPGNRPASVGTGRQDPRNVTRLLVELKRGLKAGTYTARWTCVAGDGHHQNGSFTFRIKK